jgi:hypothetical protein
VDEEYNNPGDYGYSGYTAYCGDTENVGATEQASSGSETVYPNTTTTYTYTCTNANGSHTASVTINVVPPTPPPTAALSANPSTINAGSSSTLSWTCTDSTSAYISGVGGVATGGSTGVSPSSNTTYGLTCYGPSGQATSYATVTVNAACTGTPNACGQTSSGYVVNGSCNAPTPANPSYYGTSCTLTSAPNACGQTTQSNTGTYDCNAQCTGTPPAPPSDSLCNHPPAAPQLWGLYESATATYYGASAPGYHAQGYAEYANSVDPDGDAVDYLFYFYNTQTGAYTTVDWSGWVSSGSWNYVTGLAGLPPGTYLVGAYAYDSNATYSPFSGWATLTLTNPTVTVSCTGTPGSGTVNDTYSWSASNATGGNGGPYTYTWSGTGLDGKSGQTTTSNYISGGNYTGSVTATDSVGNSSAATACTVAAGGCSGGCVSVESVPTVGLTATPDTINPGQSSSLSWSATHATSCQFTDEGSARGTSGTRVVSPSATATYGITCNGPGGSATAYADVTVIQPAAYITATPVRVAASGSTQLSWSATHVNSCSISGTDGYNWSSGAVANVATTSATRTINAQTKYTLTCTTLSSPVTSSVTVNVLPNFTEF